MSYRNWSNTLFISITILIVSSLILCTVPKGIILAITQVTFIGSAIISTLSYVVAMDKDPRS